MRVPVDARILALSLVLGLSMFGCKKKAETATAPSDAAGEAQMPEDSDPLGQLAALEGRMRALGLPTASDKQPAPGETGDADVAATELGEGESKGAANEPRAEEAPTPDGAAVQPSPPPATDRDREANVCSDVCSLSDSICDLEVRICSLAEEHTNDSIYADACERAVEDCEVAGDACNGCG